MKKSHRYIYGPVASWRLGNSLGIDPISRGEKVCTFNCNYCQLGRTKVFTDERRDFVSLNGMIKEVKALPPLDIDYVTFSGAGEPTLAKNLGTMIKALRKIRNEKIAVITNSSLMDRKDVREDLSLADFVLAKLDACFEDLFMKINRPMRTIRFGAVVAALKEFRSVSAARFALQIMFTAANKDYAQEMAQMAKEINPHEIQVNTPLRPCGVKPLAPPEIHEIEQCFRNTCGKNVNIMNVYEAEKRKVMPVSEPDTLKRRGKGP